MPPARASRFLAVPHARQGGCYAAQAMTLLRKHFDLENELPFCAQLLRFDKEDHALVVKLHHLVTDGWSQQIFWSELETIYAAMSMAARLHYSDLPLSTGILSRGSERGL